MVILGPNNYEDKKNHIETPHARSKGNDDFLTEEEQSITRSELGKLMWLTRIARPDAIYDASAASRNFANCKPDVSKEEILDNDIQKEEPINADVPEPSDFGHMPGFKNFLPESLKEASKVNLFKRPKKADTSKTHCAVANLFTPKESY